VTQTLQAIEYETKLLDSSVIVRDGRVEVYPEAQSAGRVTVRFLKDRLELQAGGVIGVIPLNNDLTLEVSTRVPVARVEEIIRRAGGTKLVPLPYDRGFVPSAQDFIDVDDLIAAQFRVVLGQLPFEGLYKTYVQRTEWGPSPRGRILASPTFIQMRTSLRPQAAYEYFARTANNPPNQLILAAGNHLASLLEKKTSGPSRQAMALRAQLELFDGVNPVEHQAVGQLPSNRPVLEQTVELAQLILTRGGVRFYGGGRVRLPSFLINMETVFEDYARTVLQRSSQLSAYEVLHGEEKPPKGGAGHVFEIAGALGNTAATPDIVIKREGLVRAIVEVKYKPCESKPLRDNLNQTIVYGVAYNSPIVVLLYPCVGEQQTTVEFLGRVRGISCFKATLQLMNPNLDAEEERLAELLAKLFDDQPDMAAA
jgi:5-methylcytosine-specific restriction enzyme subunit McrC